MKTPKLYFYDTWLACFLLGLREAGELDDSSLKGGMFENLAISNILKMQYEVKGAITCHPPGPAAGVQFLFRNGACPSLSPDPIRIAVWFSIFGDR